MTTSQPPAPSPLDVTLRAERIDDLRHTLWAQIEASDGPTTPEYLRAQAQTWEQAGRDEWAAAHRAVADEMERWPAPAPACDMADGCGAPAGRPCEPGCPSLATDEAGPPETVGDEDPADEPFDGYAEWCARLEPAPVTYPRITRHGLDVVHHLVDTGYSGDEGIASVREVIAALQSIENQDRPVMLITRDGAGWVTRVRDEHSGSVDILAQQAEL